MIANRTEWNTKHRELRKALSQPDRLEEARSLFIELHNCLHSGSGWSLEEELWAGLNEAEFRCVPPGEEHSIAWCLWHLTRIEDVTMSVLVCNAPQVFSSGGWELRLHAPIRDTGNEINLEMVGELSTKVAFEELRAYRNAVGAQTQKVVSGLQTADLKRKTPPDRLQRLLDEGALFPKSQEVLDYWSRLTVAGLLLMPPTRHNLVHLNEALTLKRKLRKYLRSGLL